MRERGRCSPAHSKERCLQRTAAMRAGEMFFTHRDPMGWVFPADRLRPDDVPPFRWTHCPFCSGQLPASSPELLWEKFRRLFDKGEGEE